MRTVIGPNGKDVFAIAFCHRHRGRIEVGSALVEALSRDEALGIAHRMTEKLPGNVMINVQSKFGAYDAETCKFFEPAVSR